MRVVFDARAAATGHHGISRVAGELARALPAELPAGWQLDLLTLAPAPEAAAAANAHAKPALPPPRSIACRARPYSVREQWEVPRRLRPEPLDLYHLPTFWGPFAVPARVRIHTVYDLIHVDYYGRSKLRYRVLYGHGVARLARAAKLVVAASAAAAHDVAERFRLGAGCVRVIPPGVDHVFREPARAPAAALAPGEFIYSFASPRPHKNVAGLLAAYAEYRTLVAAPLPLALAGRTPAAPGVVVLPSLSDGELRWLHENARLGLFLSECEGFDLPLLESIACGCPVLASDIAAHRELVAGPAALTPLAPFEIARRIADLSRALLRDGGSAERGLAMAARFTWQAAARGVAALWREALSG